MLNIIIVLGLVCTIGLAIYHGSRRDLREPPVVSSGIPFIGHLIGIARHGIGYFALQCQKHPTYPIFSLNMFASKIHVIASPDLLYAVQRNSKTISFEPLFTNVAKQLAGVRGNTLNLIREVESGGHGLGKGMIDAIVPTLTGNSLDKLNRQIFRSLRPLFDDLDAPCTLDLYKWCQDTITIASTNGKYGDLNPFQDQATADGFWHFQSNFSLLLGDLPIWLTSRKAWKGREKIVDALAKYYSLGGHKNASDTTLASFNKAHSAGLSMEDTARLETITAIGLLSNTVPATFWVLYNLYSRPKLLSDIREEIERNALKITEDGTHVIELSDIRDNCPLFMSAYQEILRTRTTSASVRIVTKDVLLAQQYLLKAGSVVAIPADPMGRNPNVWGSSADEFDERRFIKPTPSESRSENKTKESRRFAKFMAFGVPPVLCPGRHLASGEVLGITAMMMMRYDISPVSGAWQEPPTTPLSLVSVMGPLKEAYNVHVSKRNGFEDRTWDFRLEDGKGSYPLIIG